MKAAFVVTKKLLGGSVPACCTDRHLLFLDKLRESGKTNMYLAGSFLRAKFHLSKVDSHAVLSFWMKTFEERHPCE